MQQAELGRNSPAVLLKLGESVGGTPPSVTLLRLHGVGLLTQHPQHPSPRRCHLWGCWLPSQDPCLCKKLCSKWDLN